MSYEIVTGIKENLKDGIITVTSYPNNVHPRYINKWTLRTTDDSYRLLMDNIILGNLKLSNNLVKWNYACVKALEYAKNTMPIRYGKCPDGSIIELMPKANVTQYIYRQYKYDDNRDRILTELDKGMLKAFIDSLKLKDTKKVYAAVSGGRYCKLFGSHRYKYNYCFRNNFALTFKEAYITMYKLENYFKLKASISLMEKELILEG